MKKANYLHKRHYKICLNYRRFLFFPPLPFGYLLPNLMQVLLYQDNVVLLEKKNSSKNTQQPGNPQNSGSRSMLQEVSFPAVIISGLGSTSPKSRHQP